MSFGLTLPRQRFVRLGALADRDLGQANSIVEALSSRTFTLQHRLIEAQREGATIDADLAQSILAFDQDVDTLAQRIPELEHTELTAWLAQAHQTSEELGYLEQQLAAIVDRTTGTQVGMLIGGLVLLAGAAVGVSYLIKKKGVSGLRGTRAQHHAAYRQYLRAADQRLSEGNLWSGEAAMRFAQAESHWIKRTTTDRAQESDLWKKTIALRDKKEKRTGSWL